MVCTHIRWRSLALYFTGVTLGGQSISAAENRRFPAVFCLLTVLVAIASSPRLSHAHVSLAKIFGPIYDSHEIRGDRIVVKFKHAGAGLTTRNEKPLDWFEITDGTKDRNKLKYVKAEAKIVGADTVEVWAAEVKNPRCVRFGWHTLARFNLMNKEGLPAVSFRAEPGPAK